jgi:hypothetical protein
VQGDHHGVGIVPSQFRGGPGQDGRGPTRSRLEEKILRRELRYRGEYRPGEILSGQDAEASRRDEWQDPLHGIGQQWSLAGEREELFRAFWCRDRPEPGADPSGQDNRPEEIVSL